MPPVKVGSRFFFTMCLSLRGQAYLFPLPSQAGGPNCTSIKRRKQLSDIGIVLTECTSPAEFILRMNPYLCIEIISYKNKI